ncbi:unnamed protein product [Dibothriocephalus latus]|uniref:Uncharacterized protein n=1 Tax=Dibothriocephalus latus TaxID=60516 RepID=A0A3P7M5I9_DIBLA|nr:unnamed protein product [Dibothriocephalus latus]
MRDFDLSSLPATDRSESIIYCSRPSSAAVAAFSPNDDTVASVSSVPVDQQPRLPRRKSLESGQDLTRSGLAGSRHRRSKSADPCLEPIAQARSRLDSAGFRNSKGSRNTSTPDNADVSTESGFIDAGAALSEPTTCSLPKGRKGEDEKDDEGVLESSNEKQPQHVQPKPRAPRQRRENAYAGITPADGSPASAQPDSVSDRNRQVTLFGPSGKRIQQSEEPHETDQTLSGSQDGLRSGQRGLKLSDLMLSGASLAPYSVNQHVELHTSPRMNSMAGQLMAKDNLFSDSLSSISEERSQNLDLSAEHPGEPRASDRKSSSAKGPPGEGDYAARERSSNASSSAQSSLPHLSGESGADVFGPPDMLPLFVVSEETGQHSGNEKRKPIVGNSEWSLEDIESLSQVSSEPSKSPLSLSFSFRLACFLFLSF